MLGSKLHFQLVHSSLDGEDHLQGVELCLLDLLHQLVDLLRLKSRLLDLPPNFRLEQLQLPHQPRPVLLRFLLQVPFHARLLLADALS